MFLSLRLLKALLQIEEEDGILAENDDFLPSSGH